MKILTLVALLAFTPAWAKLPPPPPVDPAKAEECLENQPSHRRKLMETISMIQKSSNWRVGLWLPMSC